MANAAARWSFCGSSTFFACFVLFLYLFSEVGASGHLVVLRENAGPHRRLAVRATDNVIFTVTTTETLPTTTQTRTIPFAPGPTGTPTSSDFNSVTGSPSSTPSSSPSSSAPPSSIPTTSSIRSSSAVASSTRRSSDVRSSESSEKPTSTSVRSRTASKLSSATPSSSVSPSQPSAAAFASSSDPTPVTTLGFASVPSSPAPVIPSTTLETTTPLTTTPSESTPVVAAASNSSGFWNKKGAVAAVFVIISLVAAGALIVAFVVLRRRYRARKLREDHADLWEKFSDNTHHTTRSDSPGPSINAAPLDAFAARDESYIPASTDRQQHLSTGFYSSMPIQHPDYYPDYPPGTTGSQQQNGVASQSQSRVVPAPAALREPVGRGSYQQSVDSFYGATGRAL